MKTMYVDARDEHLVLPIYWLPKDLEWQIPDNVKMKEIGYTDGLRIVVIYRKGNNWVKRHDRIWHAVEVACQHDGYSVAALRAHRTTRKKRESKRMREAKRRMRNMFDE